MEVTPVFGELAVYLFIFFFFRALPFLRLA